MKRASMQSRWSRRSRVALLLASAAAAALVAANAQIIAAPDKVDELEEREYTEAQAELAFDIETRDPRTTIDINIYTYSEPTYFTIGLLLDPCRGGAYDCCSDTFGEPAYTTATLSSEIKISLVDELGVPLDESVSRVGDRPTRIDSDCYVDADLGPYRLQKTLTAAGTLNVTRNFTESGCLDRQLALAPIEDAVMPACWDRNASIDALASCYSVDGRQKQRCVAVAYSQTGYIVQCYGAFALDNHCGTFLEVHEPNSEIILSQVRLLGEYTSGFRTTILPLFYRGDRTRTICKGDYELWWVLRTRYNFIVQKRKKFRVMNPPCDFDSVTNEYRNYHTL